MTENLLCHECALLHAERLALLYPLRQLPLPEQSSHLKELKREVVIVMMVILFQ